LKTKTIDDEVLMITNKRAGVVGGHKTKPSGGGAR
jgi:hypothetical protein